MQYRINQQQFKHLLKDVIITYHINGAFYIINYKNVVNKNKFGFLYPYRRVKSFD